MDVSWSTVFLCVLLLVLGYVFTNILVAVLEFRRKCKALMKLPQLPSHWLYGHSREMFAESSRSVLDFAMEVVEKRNCKVFVLWAGMVPCVEICHPDTFKQVSQTVLDKDNSMTGGYRLLKVFFGEGLLGSNGSKWERNRKLLTPAFHFHILSGYIEVMNKTVDILLEQLQTAAAKGNSVDTFPYICRSTLDVLVRCSLSYEGNFQINQNSQYITAVQRILELETKRYMHSWKLIDFLFFLSPDGRELKRLCKVSRAFTENIINARREELINHPDLAKKRRLDFLDILLTARDENGKGLSPEEIHDEVDTFTFAGHDTTACTIGWAIYALALYPEYQAKVYQDVCGVLGEASDVTADHLGKFTYLTYFLKESMRYYSAVPIFVRRNSDPLEIDGYEIPSDCGIYLNAYLIHHNKRVWRDHDVFTPERFDAYHRDDNGIFGFLPFSAGSRYCVPFMPGGLCNPSELDQNCIGQVFAMNEVKITLAKLIQKFEIVRDPDHVTDIRPEFVMRPSNGIRVFLKKREN